MPNITPIPVDSLGSRSVPQHLLPEDNREVLSIGLREKQAIEAGFGDELGRLYAEIATNRLQATMLNEHIRNESKMYIDGYYQIDESNLDNPAWHIVRFDTIELQGDRCYPYTVNNTAFWEIGTAGRYQISGDVRVLFVNSTGGTPNRYDGAKAYIDRFLVDNALADLRIALYNTDGTKKQDMGLESLLTYYQNEGHYPYCLAFNFPLANIVYLEAGEKIDIRLNIVSYSLPGNPRFQIEGYCGIHLINENRQNDIIDYTSE